MKAAATAVSSLVPRSCHAHKDSVLLPLFPIFLHSYIGSSVLSVIFTALFLEPWGGGADAGVLFKPEHCLRNTV